MNKVLVLFFALTMTAACSSSSSDPKKDAPGGNPPNEQNKNTTDYSTCDRGEPASSIEGSWFFQQANKNMTLDLNVAITASEFRMTNTCKSGDQSLTVQTVSPAHHDGQTLVIEKSQSKSDKKADDNGNWINCNVGIEASTQDYSFRGSCLVLKTEGTTNETILVPASRY
jgi:hypothetical protein